jgi:hypothetical protein
MFIFGVTVVLYLRFHVPTFFQWVHDQLRVLGKFREQLKRAAM